MATATRMLGINEIEKIQQETKRLGWILGITYVPICLLMLLTIAIPTGSLIYSVIEGILDFDILFFAVGCVAALATIMSIAPRIGGSAILYAGFGLLTSPVGELLSGGLLILRARNTISSGLVPVTANRGGSGLGRRVLTILFFVFVVAMMKSCWYDFGGLLAKYGTPK